MNARIEKYLKGYNLIQTFGWSLAIILHTFNSFASYFVICIFQFIALAEIYYAYKKWNSSSPFFCLVQIGARLFILALVSFLYHDTYNQPIQYFNEVVYLMLLSWCTAEIIRYRYYVMLLFHKRINYLVWLRYTAFIILYPIGICCEFFILYYTFTFYSMLVVKVLLLLIAICYLILFPKLYLHLLNQRKLKMSIATQNFNL